MALVHTANRSRTWSLSLIRGYKQSCQRHYHLPPPPLLNTDPLKKYTSYPQHIRIPDARIAKLASKKRRVFHDDYKHWVVPVFCNERALASARFAMDAIKANNVGENEISRFVRLVRASKSTAYCTPRSLYYCLTFEATDHKGDLTVCYAEVLEFDGLPCSCKNWIVDVGSSFRYPFTHFQSRQVWSKNKSMVNHDDILTRLMKFEENQDDNDSIDSAHDVVDLEEARDYAFSAVEMYNEINKEGNTISLIGNVLYASKGQVEGSAFYLILFEVISEENVSTLIFATLHVSEFNYHELIDWKSAEFETETQMHRQRELWRERMGAAIGVTDIGEKPAEADVLVQSTDKKWQFIKSEVESKEEEEESEEKQEYEYESEEYEYEEEHGEQEYD